MRWALFATVALLLTACGAGTPRTTRELRAQLASGELEAAREAAPDLVAQVEAALDDADAAERAGDEPAAQDHATRARLFLQAAQNEAARAGDETARAGLERSVGEVLEQARRDETAREAVSLELRRLAAARTAGEEARQSFETAATDEGRPARGRRVSLAETADVRRAAAVRRARARLAIAAARALGATDETLSPIEERLASSESAREPAAQLAGADRAHQDAIAALGQTRRTFDGPGPDGAQALAEAARAEGFEVVTMPEGTAVEVGGLFRGASTTPARSASRAIEGLARLLAAHPHGPVQVQAQATQAGSAGDRIATSRANTIERALSRAGASGERLDAQALPAALRADPAVERVRVLFVAYAVRP